MTSKSTSNFNVFQGENIGREIEKEWKVKENKETLWKRLADVIESQKKKKLKFFKAETMSCQE